MHRYTTSQERRSRLGARRPAGFTLIELVMSMVVVSLLMGAVGSTVLLASRSVPAVEAPMNQRIAAARILEQITAELESANQIKSLSAGSIELSVADRNRDGADEVIRYRWTGAGQPLMRQYNNGAYVAVLDAVEALALDVQTQAVEDPTAEAPTVEDPWMILFLQNDTNVGRAGTVNVSPGVALAEGFTAVLDDAVAWRPLRVAIRAIPVAPTDGVFRVAIRTAGSDGRPDALVWSELVNEADLNPAEFWYFGTTDIGYLDVNTTYFLTVEHVSGDTAVSLVMGTSPEVAHYQLDGGNWVQQDPAAMWGYVQCMPVVEDPDWTPPTIDVAHRVELSLQLTADAVPTRTAVTLLNQVEAP